MLKLANIAFVASAALLLGGCCCPISGRYAGGCCPDGANAGGYASEGASDCTPLGRGQRLHSKHPGGLLARRHALRHLGDDSLSAGTQHADYVSPLPRFHPVPTHPVFEPLPLYPPLQPLDAPPHTADIYVK